MPFHAVLREEHLLTDATLNILLTILMDTLHVFLQISFVIGLISTFWAVEPFRQVRKVRRHVHLER